MLLHSNSNTSYCFTLVLQFPFTICSSHCGLACGQVPPTTCSIASKLHFFWVCDSMLEPTRQTTRPCSETSLLVLLHKAISNCSFVSWCPCLNSKASTLITVLYFFQTSLPPIQRRGPLSHQARYLSKHPHTRCFIDTCSH